MTAANISVAISALLELTIQIQKVAQLIQAARAEGRDISDSELDSLAAEDDAARKALDEAIARARSGN